MRLRRLTSVLWPGLIQAWSLSRADAFMLAAAFAAAVNFGLLVTFVWPGVPVEGVPSGAAGWASWLAVLGLWVVGSWALRPGATVLDRRAAEALPQCDAWFREAQAAYLKGHWIEAETAIGKVLRKSPHDVESRLLKASILRRTKRSEEAKQVLQALQQDFRAGRWLLEIERELDQIRRRESEVKKLGQAA